jgi:hypothetical protein
MIVARIAPVLVLALCSSLALAQSAPTDFTLATPGEPFAEPLATRVNALSASALAAHIALLASPSLEGRGLGTRGLDAAAEYAAASLKLAGITPFGAGKGADASYFQPVPVRRFRLAKGQVEIARRDGETLVSRTFTSGVDCVIAPRAPQTITAPVVFAGFGIREPPPGRDDYRGLDVRGRIVMIRAGTPDGAEWQTPEMLARYPREGDGRFKAKLEVARKLGAAAVLAVEDADFGTAVAADQAKEELGFGAYDARDESTPLIRVSSAVARSVLGDDAAARRLTPATATIRITADETLFVSRNVLGIIPGSDPALREEAVVIGAHLDHLGTVGGEVFAGADDNASGVAALIEIARAFEAAPEKPKRTLVFAFWTGEEEGKFGSGHYVRNPRWPLRYTVAYLNLDMIGHPWLAQEIRQLVVDSKLPDGETYLSQVKAESFVEPGVPRNAPALEAALRKSAKGNGLAMHVDWTDGKHGGSDYRDFAREGVPFIRFFGNFFPDYHTPRDTAESIDPAQAARVARFAFATAWELAN